MIKKLLTIALVASGIFANAQSFTATYSFAATTTLSGMTDPSTPPVVTGITFGSFAAVGTGTANASAGRFSFNNWPIATLSGSTSATSYSAMGGTINLGAYYGVTVSPDAGNTVTLDSVVFSSRRTSTGPRSFAVRSSVDAYGANIPASVPTSTLLSIAGTDEFFYTVDAATTSNYNLGNKVTTSATGFIGFSSPITFRFYAWNAEQLTGNFGIDDVSFYGTVSIATGFGSVSTDLNSNFKMYPVPNTTGIVYIEAKNTEATSIEITDVLGKVVYSTSTNNQSKIEINVADLSTGNYSVKIVTPTGSSVKKLVVVK